MASPAVADVTSTASGTGSHATLTANYPATVNAGDLLICLFVQGSDQTTIWPAGWNELDDANFGGAGSVGAAIAWREAVGDEDGGTFVIDNSGTSELCCLVYRITGAEDPDTQAPEFSTAASGNDTSPNSGSVTPTGGSKDYLFLSVFGQDGLSSVTADPTSYSNEQIIESSAGSLGCTAVGTERQLTATSDDPGAFTITNQEKWVAWTIAVHPGAAAGANPKGPLGMPLHGPFGGPI